MPVIKTFHHRSEIDGLRAVAVLAVVLFHTGFGCPGGYIGVDVFFVISGFLITSLVWKDLEAGSFSFSNFWERRARRIIPALVVVTIATLIAGWFLLLPQDFKSLGRAAASQAVFAANIHYLLDSGYFASISDEKPLLHTWSLAVEEQFYFVVPLLLWGMFRVKCLRGRVAVILVLSVGFLLSFVASIYGVARNPEAAFYLLPTRAWELLMGSLVAFLPIEVLFLERRLLREFCAFLGLALIVIPIVIYSRDTPFPGFAALPPCLGAALLIWANGRVESTAPTRVGAVLSTRPFVFIGLISYSLYLWHWPFVAFSKYLALVPLTSGHRAAMLVLGFASAILSWKYVETPFRKRKLCASRKSMLTFAAGGLGAVFLCGLVCRATNGFPQRFPPQVQEFANAVADRAFTNELTTVDIQANRLVPIGMTASKSRPQVLVWGDSHAMSALPAVDAWLKEKGLAGRAATHSSTPPVLNWYMPYSKYGLRADSVSYNDSVFAYVQRERISEVILVGDWKAYVQHDRAFTPALLETVRRLASVGSRPLVLLDVPSQSFDVPRALSRSVISQTDISALCAKPSVLDEIQAADPEILSKIEAVGGRILNPKPKFLDSTNSYYIVHFKGTALYWDNNHLTTKGAKLMLLPILRDALTIENGAAKRLP